MRHHPYQRGRGDGPLTPHSYDQLVMAHDTRPFQPSDDRRLAANEEALMQVAPDEQAGKHLVSRYRLAYSILTAYADKPINEAADAIMHAQGEIDYLEGLADQHRLQQWAREVRAEAGHA